MPRALLPLLLVLVLAPVVLAQDEVERERPQNVILLIADGFGPASATLAREFSGEPLALDGILRGAVRTASTSSRVTDSAAGATAFASGVRTYNGAIGVDSLQHPVGTVLEAAQAQGMKTGLVATSRITHATPATFAAHVPERWDEATIAEHMAARDIDVVFGGGRKHFVPEAAGGARTDGRDLVDEVRERGTTVITDRDGFDRATDTPVLGLFADDHLAYEIDRDETDQPSLATMTQRALDLLDGTDEGFFLMVEGSRIDHAGHSNDPAAHVHDVLAYDDAVRAALDFARADGRTLVVSVADHETGGLSLGRDGVYAWHPEDLARVTASADRMREMIEAGAEPREVVRAHAGLNEMTPEEVARLGTADEPPSTLTLGHLVSERAALGWTTTGHTGIDVQLYAFGPGSEPLRGVLTNDAVGRIIADALGLDLAPVTDELREALRPAEPAESGE
jgi:alkaline phosphatase